MPLTRPFRNTVQARTARDPAYKRALLLEAIAALLRADLSTAKWVLRMMVIPLALVVQPFDAKAQEATFRDHTGDAYEIVSERRTEGATNGGSSSSSSRMTLVERVIAVNEDGLELEFDLPDGASETDRIRDWHYPARVLRSPDGSFQLLNEGELIERRAIFLEVGGWTEEMCGQWFFTWTAIKIECEPEAILETFEALDIRAATLVDGALYLAPDAIGPAPFRRSSTENGGAVFVNESPIDPIPFLQERAEADEIIASMLGDDPFIKEFRESQKVKAISGTIVTSFTTDAGGQVIHRVTEVVLEITKNDGTVEHETTTEWIDRRPLTLATPDAG